jgi:hypothetical protein
MVRLAWLALLPALFTAACAPMPADDRQPQSGYAGTVQKVFRVVRQGADLPGIRWFGKAGNVLGSALRQNGETHQYVVRTPRGQITAQSDEEISVGDCVQVIPQDGRPGPAFRYGEAAVVRSQTCG